jgi:hypothetical protein
MAADSVITFQEEYPSLENYWRSIILFGRNTASYKFALSKALLIVASTGQNVFHLEELADSFCKSICEHIKDSPKQHTGQRSRFLDACSLFNEGKISQQYLLDITVKYGFRYVIDLFHRVGQVNIPVSFYEKDYHDKKIILTDNIFKLSESPQFENLPLETEARWKLVETAWQLGVSHNMLQVKYDDVGRGLYVELGKFRRKSVSSVRESLNGYQKGKCFYCFDDISISSENPNFCDVDHFIPHMLAKKIPETNLDAVWNPVLSCSRCNRGSSGKFERIPSTRYLARLQKRNEFLISSYHPLRETLMAQTGNTSEKRVTFLNNVHRMAMSHIPACWETIQVGKEVF